MDVPTDAKTVKFMDLLESLGLEQHVRGPTHTHGHTLDLVITRKMENIIACPPRVCRYFSDQATVHCDMNFNKPAFQVKKISYRKVRAIDMDSLKGDLALLDLYNGGQGTPLSSSELDMLVCDYNASLSNIMLKANYSVYKMQRLALLVTSQSMITLLLHLLIYIGFQ